LILSISENSSGIDFVVRYGRLLSLFVNELSETLRLNLAKREFLLKVFGKIINFFNDPKMS